MAGRDYRQLVKLHRESATDNDETLKTFSKLADTNLVKFKQVRYDLLKDFISERKVAAKNSLNKVKKLEESSKTKRELLFMKQHKYIWFKELTKLTLQSKKYQEELDDFLQTLQTKTIEYADINLDEDDSLIIDSDDIKFINEHSHIDELENYRLNLEHDVNNFKKHTSEPIYNLNEDLKYYLAINPTKVIRKNTEKNDEILETIEQVKEQQDSLLRSLQNEFLISLEEIDCFSNELQQNELNVSEGIPYEAYLLESPDEELKQSVLNEFIIIDFKYKEKLKQLDENYAQILNNKKNYDGWSQYEHELFQHIYEQYHYHNANLTNCNFTLRDLMFDRIKRTLELYNLKLGRNELVKHEEWMIMNKYYQQQQKLIYNEWSESRKALILKAEATFQEAYEMIEIERDKKFEREKQLRICNELYAKVQKFREQKLEALEIQQKLDRLIEEERMRKLKIENEKEQRRREEQKRNINEYHERLNYEREINEDKEQERLDNLNLQLEKQAKIDAERIAYRKQILEDKKVNLEEKKFAARLEAETKEKRIEKFLDSVKPTVEHNPGRLMSFTLSELSRRGVDIKNKTNSSQNNLPFVNNDKFNDKKQMYNVYSFTDRQLNNDARLRIEARLRQAGLINNDYARAIIKHVPPPTIPRRDTVSNIHYNFDNLN